MTKKTKMPTFVRVTPPRKLKYPFGALVNVGDSFLVTRKTITYVRSIVRRREKIDGRKYVCEPQYIGIRVFRVD